MPKEFSRTTRVAELIKRELAVLLQTELKDPRLGMITISAVEVSRDLEHAKIFVSTLGDASQISSAVDQLNKAASFIRRELGKRVKLRLTPSLAFLQDKSITEGKQLSHLIDNLTRDLPPNSEDDDNQE